MAHSRFLAAAAALGFLVPSQLTAQDAPTMLTRVQADGRPAANVVVAVYLDGTRRPIATTGASGLAVVEFGRLPLEAGTRLVAFARRCGEEAEIQFARSASALPLLPSECTRERLGVVLWSRTERLDVTLGEAPRMAAQATEEAVRARSGLRIELGPALAFAGGDEISNVGTGFGGELIVGYDSPGGFGLGVVASGMRHDLEGLDEALWRWAVGIEPRYTFDRPEWDARPYVFGRVARQWLDSEAGSGLATETGWSFGGGAGVAFPFVAGTMVDLSARFETLSVGTEGFDRSGTLLTAGAAIRY